MEKIDFYQAQAEWFGFSAQSAITLATRRNENSYLIHAETMQEFAVTTARVAAHFGLLALGQQIILEPVEF